jgi:hypothetical protein
VSAHRWDTHRNVRVRCFGCQTVEMGASLLYRFHGTRCRRNPVVRDDKNNIRLLLLR